MRKTKEELNVIMKSEGVNRLWSWSKIDCFINSHYEYFLKYIKKVPEDRTDCVYANTGSIAHDILEKYYTKQIPYADMIDMFEDGWITAVEIADLKFDRNDETKNDSIKAKYHDDLYHFFQNHVPLSYKPMIEQFVKVRVDNNVLQGYIDCCFKDEDGNIHIVDFKTSSMYKGKTLEEKSGQLTIYALGLIQSGVPIDKIKICFNFLKYCTIQYEQANGTTKSRDVERYKIGDCLQSNAKMWLKKLGYSEEDIDAYLKKMLDTNSIDFLPDSVKSKYKISDCYVYIPLDNKLIQKWSDTVSSAIKDIECREDDYNETHSDKCFWDSEDRVKAQSFYYATLCGYSPKLMKPYGEYLEKLEKVKNGCDLFNNVGSEICDDNSDYYVKNNKSTLDLSWLDEI